MRSRRAGCAIPQLPNAFVYREKIVADCSCDGKSPTGLVPFEAATIRPCAPATSSRPGTV